MKNLLRKIPITYNIHLVFLTVLITIFLSDSIRIESQAQDKNISSDGKELFIKNRCVNCHTIGRGRFVGPDLAGISGKYNKDEIKKWIQNPELIYRDRGKMPVNDGYPPMPPLNISPTDAEAISEYLSVVKTGPDKYDEGGDISGRVVNNSTDKAAEGVELTLKAYIGDRVTDEIKTISDTEGKFGFTDLPWDRSYTVSLNYKGAEYITKKMVFSPDEDSKAIDLPIYEPTNKENALSIEESHMIVEISEDSISVADLTVFNNRGKNIYIGKMNTNNGRSETLRFSLPRDAGNVRFIHGISQENVVKTNLGFSDTSGVWPGIKRVVYTYTLPYNSGSNVILKEINYPTENFLLLVSDSGEKVTVDGLSGGNTVQIENENYLKWSGVDLDPGRELKLIIHKPLDRQNILKYAAFGILLLFLGAGVIYSSMFKGQVITTKNKSKILEDLDREREIIVNEIADLDEKFEGSEIVEPEYRDGRQRRKEKLIDIIQRISRLRAE